MTARTLLAGSISESGITRVLGDLEQLGMTGVLLFEASDACGEVELFKGQIAAEQEARRDGLDSVELLLSLHDGEFVVYPKLPPLPVSRGNDTRRRGSLAVHPPADLMRYCEQAVLTGRLLLEKDGRIAVANYERGELVDVAIDNAGPDEFHKALDWEEGTFRVDAVIPRLSEPPPPAPPIAEVDAFAAPAEARLVGTAPLYPGHERDEDRTIRIVHRKPLTEAARPSRQESATTLGVTDNEAQPKASIRGALFWVGVITMMMALCLSILALLPPLE